MKKVEISEDEFVKVCIDFMDNIDIVIGSLKVDDVFMGEEIIRNLYRRACDILSVCGEEKLDEAMEYIFYDDYDFMLIVDVLSPMNDKGKLIAEKFYKEYQVELKVA